MSARWIAIFFVAGCSSSSAPPMPERGEGTIEVLLPNPPDGGVVTWSNWAGTFTKDYCVTCHNPTANCGGNGCHAAGDSVLFDLRDQAAFVAREEVIRCGIATAQDPAWSCGTTEPLSFPLLATSKNNPFPTDEQRAIVVAWIDAGCP